MSKFFRSTTKWRKTCLGAILGRFGSLFSDVRACAYGFRMLIFARPHAHRRVRQGILGAPEGSGGHLGGVLGGLGTILELLFEQFNF